MEELYPRLKSLTLLARQYDIGINIDAEEADRLEISLDLLEKLCFEPELAGWNGIGFVIQAYQKRCPLVIDYLIDLATRSRRRLMIRLVKARTGIVKSSVHRWTALKVIRFIPARCIPTFLILPVRKNCWRCQI